MTTIAFKDGIIAYDSRVTAGSQIVSDKAQKSAVYGGIRFFFAGDVCGQVDLAQWFINPSYKMDAHLNVEAMVWDGENLWHIGKPANEDPWRALECLSHVRALGSGAEYAIGAMDAGATAKEAVRIAAGRAVHTGGRIRVYVLK